MFLENVVVGLKLFFEDGILLLDNLEWVFEDFFIVLKFNMDLMIIVIIDNDCCWVGVYWVFNGCLW